MADDEDGSAPTIRRAVTGDAAALADVGRRLFEETFGPMNTPEDMDLYLRGAFGEAIQRAELLNPDRRTLVVEDVEGSLIGYAMLALGTDAAGVVGARPGEIQRFYIDRKWHGRGIADILMGACVEECTTWACDVIWLAVWEKNGRAISLYERHGFRRVGEKTFILGHDEQHDYVMSRSLT
jgi:ribosomal protein S18 acetylase RimI-like enzyme